MYYKQYTREASFVARGARQFLMKPSHSRLGSHRDWSPYSLEWPICCAKLRDAETPACALAQLPLSG